MPARPAGVLIHRQFASFLLLPAQVLYGLQRIAPFGLRGYIFLTSKATAAKAPQESLFRVKGGKAIQPESSLWLLISSQVTVLPRPFFFFHANANASNTARKYLSYGYHVISGPFNMGTFTAKDFLVGVRSTLRPRWRRFSMRASLYPRPPSSQQLCMFTGTYHIDPQLRD